jgi:hypothetical protein
MIHYWKERPVIAKFRDEAMSQLKTFFLKKQQSEPIYPYLAT